MNDRAPLLAIILILFIALWYLHKIAKHKHFVCPKCGNSFKVGKFKLLVTPHFFRYRYLKCHQCQRRSLMYPVDD